MVQKAWRIIPRPLLETILNNHAQHHRVPQPLILHGPRGVGKTTLILERLLDDWNTGPHVTGYVDFAENMRDQHPKYGCSFPWASWSNCQPQPALLSLRNQLEESLESMVIRGIKLGKISSHQIFTTINKWHNPTTAIERICGLNVINSLRINSKRDVVKRDDSKRRKSKVSAVAAASSLSSLLNLWDRAVFQLSVRLNAKESFGGDVSLVEDSYYREAMAALELAKEVIKVQQGWRANAIKHLNETGGFSRPLGHSATDWPCLLLELLSSAAEVGYFQPKLVINNIDVLKNAVLTDDTTVNASMYHDSFIWRTIALCVNERCLPVILVTSDSARFYVLILHDFIWSLSRTRYAWSQATTLPKLLLIMDFQIFSSLVRVMDEKGSTFEDIVDAYLAYLQLTVVDPAMEKALLHLQKFALDAQSGKVSKDRLRFGAPWRHPPHTDDPSICHQWAKIQLLDFVQSLVNTEFGVNYLADCSLEILDDPSAVALLEVGLLYAQRDPSFIRPITRGIQRCLARWLVQQRLQMNFKQSVEFLWQRSVRGRSYRHLMLQIR
ncbi:uncharacterized protein [Coffea arabica]|uniref:Uncharacterized protein isoform X2 n=1 Tax=Coffea arabica TaxID=13443 RepID=A0A6P6WEN6_COFAR|nr:uncharacterized protein LOC113732370 isoform X2 [Coffea arabica]